MKQRTYLCIDMKSFYASVECAERGLNPFEVNLVVADPTRSSNTICLAISPKMKSLGVKNRCRLGEIPKGMDFITAMPRMGLYEDYCAEIYSIYLDYMDKTDVYQYSIDEAFIDATDYLKLYEKTPVQFAKMLLDEIASRLKIPATVGIGTNMYLAKIALDITAKRTKDHIGYLDEKLFKEQLWDYTPLTDFWGIGKGKSDRLAKYGIKTMRGIAEAPEELLYRIFGIDAELMIDHAKGIEPCTLEDIHNYKSKSKSISNSQVLFKDTPFDEARIIISEMVLEASQQLKKRKMITSKVGIGVVYSKGYIPSTGEVLNVHAATNAFSILNEYALKAFDATTVRGAPIRKLCVTMPDIADESAEGYDLFCDYEKIAKENKAEKAVLSIKEKFGKNAMLRAIDFKEGATQRERNKMIGGHNGGEE